MTNTLTNMSVYRFLSYIFCFSCLINIVRCEGEVVDFNNKTLSSQVIQTRTQSLRNFMLVRNGLRKMRTDDAFLFRFLYATDFNVNQSEKKVKKYYRYIRDEIDWIATNISDRIKSFMHMNFNAMLPAVDREGKKIFYLKFDNLDPTKLSFADMSQLEGIWYESVLDDPNVQRHGISFLVNINRLSPEIMGWLTPSNIIKYMRKLDNIIVRNYTISVVRSSPVMYIVLQMAWPYIPVQIREKFRFYYDHDDLDLLLEQISSDNLPRECGGNLMVDFAALKAELLSRTEEINRKLEHYKLITSQ